MTENLLNGNIAEARRQAKRFSELAIKGYLRDERGWSPVRARRAATYLKTGQGWQNYCDAD